MKPRSRDAGPTTSPGVTVSSPGAGHKGKGKQGKPPTPEIKVKAEAKVKSEAKGKSGGMKRQGSSPNSTSSSPCPDSKRPKKSPSGGAGGGPSSPGGARSPRAAGESPMHEKFKAKADPEKARSPKAAAKGKNGAEHALMKKKFPGGDASEPLSGHPSSSGSGRPSALSQDAATGVGNASQPLPQVSSENSCSSWRCSLGQAPHSWDV